MNKRINFSMLSRMLLLLPFLCACDDFLDEKPSKSDVIPYSLQDLQALMDAGNRINLGNYCPLLEAGTDDFYLDGAGFASLTEFQKDIYAWRDEPIYSPTDMGNIWGNSYMPVAIANTVIDELKNIKDYAGLNPSEIEGTALFHRGFSHFTTAQVYCENFKPGVNENGLGIPLRLTSDVSVKSNRSTLGETYESILSDLTEAAELLPSTSLYKTRPNRLTAYAALARVYLSIQDYDNAAKYAGLVLEENSMLFSFEEEINAEANFPFEPMNKETIFFAYSAGLVMLNPTRAFVDSLLYESFHNDDLRKRAFFQETNDGKHSFKGTYMGFGFGSFFVGMTVPEMYLIKAECLARTGQAQEAISLLNLLVSTRWKAGTYQEYELESADEALRIILDERRKELIMKGVRWSDLKRLNTDNRFAKNLVRIVNGEVIVLPPSDKRYLYLIPQEVVRQTGMEQNER